MALDLHADIFCAGSNMKVLELTGEKVNVFPFSHKLSAVEDIPIAMVATVWENPWNGEAWILVIHEALYFGSKLKELLLCPNQIRANGIRVEDTPAQFDSHLSHSLLFLMSWRSL